MLSTLRNAWKVKELKQRMIFTLLMIAIFRMGNFIPVPGIDTSKLTTLAKSGTLFGFYDLLSGGAFSRFSIFAMGVTPYINASIIMQLLTFAIPSLESLSKEGEEGRKKIQNYTKAFSIVLGFLQAFGTYAIITGYGALKPMSAFNIFVIMLTLTAASTFLMWLGEKITVKGLGNGVSVLIFVNIISRLPQTVFKLSELESTGSVNIIQIIVFVAVSLLLLVGVVVTNKGERRVPVQYAGKTTGRKMMKGGSSHIPISMSSSGVIAIIFAMSVMQFPATIAEFIPNSKFATFIHGPYSLFKPNSWQYAVMYAILIIFFSWFYTEITFKPDEMAENMHKSSGFIPGIRPGKPTQEFLEKVLLRVSIIGGVFASIIAVLPIIIDGYTSFKGISFGGTALLIEVGVALDTMRQLESQLVMRHYKGFLK
ncbi:preprotein translocase subunit SecY [Clostridium sp. KNHs214]|uniref:preprotein translocase subunit SecY n=1 Tax=Clostridium sp. KNHs214 TaxID=1540257 RepID=UPI00054FE04B|nr:preprotein translocase subunit SecY [Clostridium sp. KNHs214]